MVRSAIPGRTSARANRALADEARRDAQLRGSAALAARLIWLALFALCAVVFIVSLPVALAQLQVICVAAQCPPWQATPDTVRVLHTLRLTLLANAFVVLGLNLLLAIASFIVAWLIFWRRSDNWLALLVALFLVAFPLNLNNNLDALAALAPGWAIPVQVIEYLNGIVILFVFYLFPNGRFVPGWTRWLAIGASIYSLVTLFPDWPPLAALSRWEQASGVGLIALLGLTLTLVLAQVYRYARVSTPREREQTKWVVLGVSVALLVIIGVNIAVPNVANGQPQSFAQFIGGGLTVLAILCIPVSFGIALLRSRLWDVDVLIKRALVYGTLTALLAAIYFGAVIAAQAIAQALTGVRSLPPVAVVVSTLLIAALFTPLRRRIQAFIDRRFYRRKYDAARTLAAFAATLRSEVDLGALREHLVGVVAETMQPEHVSLWLAPPARAGKPLGVADFPADRTAR